MGFHIAEHPTMHVIYLRGEMNGESWNGLRSTVTSAIESGVDRFVIDFHGTKILDSLGVGFLVGLHHLIESKSASLIFTRVSDRIRSVLHLCRLDEVLNLVDDALEGDGVSEDLSKRMRESFESTAPCGDSEAHCEQVLDDLDGRLQRIERANRILHDLATHSGMEAETSLNLYRALFEKSGDAVFVVEEKTGEILEVNQCAREMIRLGDDGLDGLTLLSLFPDLHGLSHASLVGAFRDQATERAEASLRLRPLVGESLPVRVTTSGAEHQGRSLIILHVRDASAYRVVEDHLRDQVFRLTSLNAIEQRLAECNEAGDILGELLRHVLVLLGLPNGIMLKIDHRARRVNQVLTAEEDPADIDEIRVDGSEVDLGLNCVEHLLSPAEITSLDPQALGPLASAGVLAKDWPRLPRKWINVPIVQERNIAALMVLGADAETGWENIDLTLVQNLVNLAGVILSKSSHFQEVQRAHRQHRKLFENSRDAIGVVNLETGHTVSANQEWARLTGQRLGRGMDSVLVHAIAESDWSGFHNQMSLLRETGEGRWESRLAHRSSSEETWVQIRASVVDNDPEPLALLFLINITEQRQREQEIERLSSITKSNPNPVLRVSTIGKVLWANPGVADFLHRAGCDTERPEMALPHDLPGLLQRFKNSGVGIERFEHTVAERTVLYTLSHGGDNESFIFHGLEITAFKRLELAIAASEENYRVLVEGAQEGICSIRDGQFHTANQRLCEIYGDTAASIINSPLRECVVPEDWPDLCAVLHEVTHLREKRAGVAFRIQTRDGKIKDIEATIVPAEVGGADRLLGYFTDVTEQHRLETELQQMQRIESIGQLSRGIAKDFNSLLTSIMGNVSLLMSRLDPHGDAHRLAEAVSDAAERGSDLTRELLLFARGGRFSPDVFDLNRVIADNVEFLRRALAAKIDLNFSPSTEPCPIEFDRNLVRQTLFSLCLNASEAMPKGGMIRVGVSTVNLTEEEVRRNPDAKPGPHACVEISDTGMGIPADKLSWVIEPFHSTKGGAESQGLGLPMVVSVVKPAGGFLDIKSEEGKGTTIRVYLPQTEKPLPHVRESKPSDEHPEGMVLVVDDEDLVRDLTSEILSDAGFEVLTAVNGVDGLKQFELHSDEITAVVLDIVMPVMDGPETFRQLRQRNDTLPILLASGFASAEETQELLATGCSDFLSKPFRREALLRKLDGLIEAHTD